jgi:hypothetical protein
MPEGTLTHDLTALLATAETLNHASNSINTILTAVEQQLVKANVGLEVWLIGSPLSSSTPERIDDHKMPSYTNVELGFAKLKDGWHLAARDIGLTPGPPDDFGDSPRLNPCLQLGPYPLAQASREERLAALRLLPTLIQTLHKEADKAIQAIEDAKQLLLC